MADNISTLSSTGTEGSITGDGNFYVSIVAWESGQQGATSTVNPQILECYVGTTVVGNWQADGSLNELARINAPLTIVCNPNAPTCEMLSVDLLARLAEKLTGVLLIDEAYVDFAEDNAIRLIKDYDNVIILRSMSKGYSLAGLRFGFGIAQKSQIDGLMKIKDSYNADVVALSAATAAIGDQPHLKSNVEKIISERARLTQQLRSMSFDVGESQTNFILAQHGQKNAENIYEKLNQQSIYVRYFALPGLGDKLRITIGSPQQNDKLLAALKEIIA